MLLLATATAAVEPPRLIFEPATEVNSLAAQLAQIEDARLVEMMELFGLQEAGPPIHVLLAEEGTIAARRAPSWAVGYALGNAGQVVLLPARVPAYPDGDLAGVLRHEIAHVLIARAAGRRGVPRWLNEGLALYAAREWTVGDRSRVLLATLRREQLSLPELDQGFYAGPTQAARAYALSGAFVRHLLQRHGEATAAHLLARIAEGEPFHRAFLHTTGTTFREAEDLYWKGFDRWIRWVPFVSSSGTLWLVVTLIALLAFLRRRHRDAEIRAQWEEEERQREEEETARPPGEDGWVH